MATKNPRPRGVTPLADWPAALEWVNVHDPAAALALLRLLPEPRWIRGGHMFDDRVARASFDGGRRAAVIYRSRITLYDDMIQWAWENLPQDVLDARARVAGKDDHLLQLVYDPTAEATPVRHYDGAATAGADLAEAPLSPCCHVVLTALGACSLCGEEVQ